MGQLNIPTATTVRIGRPARPIAPALVRAIANASVACQLGPLRPDNASVFASRSAPSTSRACNRRAPFECIPCALLA
jgi:hypothetical protein